MKAEVDSFGIVPRGDYSLEEGANFIGAWHHAPSEVGAFKRGH